MAITRVGVLRGGPSTEYDVSLKSGAAVLKHLPEPYLGVDIFIDKAGNWHRAGVRSTPAEALRSVDVVFNALHGTYGEDGTVQRMLDALRIPYAGSGSMASLVGFQKHLFKDVAQTRGVRMPQHLLFREDDLGDMDAFLVRLHRTMAPPWIVKPTAGGSSVGVALVRTLRDLSYILEKTLFYGPVVLVEEYIRGREATCGVIEQFRGEELYALFPVEIVHNNSFFDYDAKYSGATREICPGNFSTKEKQLIMEAAKQAHVAAGARHYSRSDMIVSPRGVYLLEINTLPGLTEQSLLPKSLEAVGSSLSQFLGHALDLALSRFER